MDGIPSVAHFVFLDARRWLSLSKLALAVVHRGFDKLNRRSLGVVRLLAADWLVSFHCWRRLRPPLWSIKTDGMELHADLIPLGARKWRLISPDGSVCTIDNPPAALVDKLRLRCQGSRQSLGAELEHELIVHDLMAPKPPKGRVLLIGGGLTAAETALGLAEAGIAVSVSAPEAAPVSLDPLSEHSSGAAAVRAWVLNRFGSANISLAPHWTAMTAGLAGLVIVATDTVQPDRAITEYLAHNYLPYLVVRAHHHSAMVGPLVDHRDGACLACLDLSMADHDPDWPRSLAALASHPAFPDRITAHWAGTQAALEASWFLRGQGTTLRSGTVEIDGKHAGVARRRWQPHPDCSCGFALDAEIVPLPLAA